ncbi:glucans biosynthesis protein MdoC, partial [Escherichia coli]
SGYDKYNALAWELISHLWFLLVLVVLTTVSMWVFSQMKHRLTSPDGVSTSTISMTKLTLIFLLLGVGYAAVRRTIFIVYPSILSDGMFNFIVMQTLFYVPFFMLGALAFINPQLKALFTTPSRSCTLGAACAFMAYLL